MPTGVYKRTKPNWNKGLTIETDERVRKISELLTGHIHSEETKIKIGLGNLGKLQSEETKIKISESLTGIKRSEETKRRISESKKGDKNPMKRPEVSRKVSESLTGHKHSEESKIKISKAGKGRKHSEESKIKISKAHKGIIFSKEHRENISKSHIGLCAGNKHYNWKGGISSEPYCDVWLDKKFKESIKERDNYKCQNPFCWNESKELHLHHINYNKKDCKPKNLITVCKSCNSRANFKRKYWEFLYNWLIISKYYGVKI